MDDIMLTFVGDTTVTGRFKPSIEANKEIFSEEILQAFSNSDCVIANLEGPLTDSIAHLKCDGLVVGPSGSLKYFADRGIRVYNLANNHIFDNGKIGFDDTLTEIVQNRCGHFGAGNNISQASKPYIVEKGDIKVAIFGITHKEGLVAKENAPGVFCHTELQILKKEIQQYKALGYIILVCYHGGEEFTLVPAPSRRKLLKTFIDIGGDLVVSNHAHVVQGVDTYKGKYIFNSIGNFVFDIVEYRHVPFVSDSILLHITIRKEREIDYKILPIKVDFDTPILYIDKSDKIQKRIAAFSDIKNYYLNWCKEASRVYFTNRKETQVVSIKSTISPKKTVFIRFFNLLKNMILNKVKREFIIGAVIGKLISKDF